MVGATRRRSALVAEQAIEFAIRLAGWSAAIFVFAILFFVCREAVPVLFEGVSIPEFLGSALWRPESVIRPQFGILALLAGTVAVTGLAMVIAVPLGFGAAIFISDFCRPRPREALKVLIELLAAIPSVVWGFVAYVITNPLIGHVTGASIGLKVLNGVGRAIGETMAVLMATGHSVRIPHGVLDPVRTLTATIAAELGETVAGGTHYRTLFLIGMLGEPNCTSRGATASARVRS